MKSILMTNQSMVYLDDEDHAIHKKRKLFYNNRSARCSETSLLLEQLILGVEKRTKIYYEDGNRLNCCRSNLSLVPFIKEVREKSGKYTGVEFRKLPHRFAIVETEGWYAFHSPYGREQIAGPFPTDKVAAEAYNCLVGEEINKVEPFVPKGGRQLESIIQDEIVHFLSLRGWMVHETNMNQFEKGWPDLNALHPKIGVRFIDVKVKEKYSITPAQKETWPKMHAFGFGPYIMTGANEEQYKKLMGPPNYMDYFPKSGKNSRSLRPMDAYKKSETKKCK